MKKAILLSLVATFIMALHVNAQNNTYNMIVTLANGTSITIGPNDIQNISFNNGAVTVSGTRLEDLLTKLTDVHTWLIGDDGYWYVDGIRTNNCAIGRDGKDGRYGKDGKDGSVVTIGDNLNWFIDGKDTGIRAYGRDGKDGEDGVYGKDGKDGSVVTIGGNGNWYIDGWDTGKSAIGPQGKDGKDGYDGKDGKDGSVVTIGGNGNWFIDGKDTGVSASVSSKIESEMEKLKNEVSELRKMIENIQTR